MMYKVAADLIVVVHFAWILFMLWGFFLTLAGVIRLYILRRPSAFMDRWIFRTLHLGGIAFVALLAALNQYCPLTVWEYNLRRPADPDLAWPGSFIVYWIERFVYPDVHPLIIVIPTIGVALFTLLAYVLCPPAKIKSFFINRDFPDQSVKS